MVLRVSLLLLLACGPSDDADGDGSATGQDCDDADATVYPGATETWYDGTDQDCAGDDDFDADGDGFASEAYNGSDCDDTDPKIHPGAGDTDTSDGLDADCARDEDTGSTDTAGEDSGDSDSEDTGTADSEDLDGDGFRDRIYGGLDCDDSDPEVYPGSADGLCLDCAGESAVSVPGDYETIGAAIDAAAPGSILCIGPGTWAENLTLDGDALALVGTDGAEATVLDGGGLASTLAATDTELALAGLTLRDGLADKGGGLYLDGGVVSLAELVVNGNGAGSGAGIYALQTALVGRDLQIWNNEATDVAGGGLFCSLCSLNLTRADLRGNVCYGGSGRTGGGGGLYLSETPDGTTLTNIVIAGNQTEARGGGIYLLKTGSVLLDHVTLVGNEALNGGGGFLQTLDEPFVLTNTVVSHNSASDAVDGLWLYETEGEFSYSDLWEENGGEVYEGTRPPASGILSEDPEFVDLDLDAHPRTWDLSPGAGSPLIDAGDPTETDPDGSGSDIGATGGPQAGVAE